MTAGPQHRQQQQPMTAGPQHRQQQQPMTAGPQHRQQQQPPPFGRSREAVYDARGAILKQGQTAAWQETRPTPRVPPKPPRRAPDPAESFFNSPDGSTETEEMRRDDCCRSVDTASTLPSAAARAESPEPQRAALVPPVPPLQRRPSWEPQRRRPRHLSTASAPLQCRSVDTASTLPSAAARAESPEPQRAALVPPVPPLQRRPSWEPQRRRPRHLSTASAAASVPFRGHRLRAAQCRRFGADPWTPPPRCPVPPPVPRLSTARAAASAPSELRTQSRQDSVPPAPTPKPPRASPVVSVFRLAVSRVRDWCNTGAVTKGGNGEEAR
ncbi:serine/arginine repetitive matrix protein 1-like [Drosophila serrata]|uniref:serine/arginine repetitive matrix protein 1-like n=1 Tax=Drosophila serrata TaxID=7274 RepID=UPI000A1D0B10|nr:serine/arginine repetitive matrix protein 1-like [Drosophila serrata]